MKIFVIHARRTGYGVIRSLKHLSPTIYIADSEITPVFKSIFVSKSFLIPDITRVSDEQFVKELIRLAKLMDYKKEKPVVYTGKDDYLVFFSKYYEILSDYYALSFETDYKILERALDKAFLPDIALKSNVKVPKTIFNPSYEDVVDQIDFPVVIKPFIKNAPDIDVVKLAFRLAICRDDDELKKNLSIIQNTGVGYLAQEYIPGEDAELHTIATYSFNGELRAWSTSKKIRQFPPSMGECSYGVTTFVPKLAELAEKLLNTLKLTGISQIEFKYYKGEFYLIEINPRVWSWHQIHSLVGVNLCELAYNSVINPDSDWEQIKPIDENRTWSFLMMDFHFNYYLNKNLGLWSLIKDHLNTDMEAFLSWDDPLVFMDHVIGTLKNFYLKITK